jgi:hypothetical protein
LPRAALFVYGNAECDEPEGLAGYPWVGQAHLKPAAAFLFTVSSGLLGLRFDLLKMAFHFEVLPFAEPE